jgi:hypothetical protein
MSFWQPPDFIRSLRAIPLERVLPLGGAQPDRRDRRKWLTAAGIISVSGAKFMNWTQGVGGGGAIDLVIHLNGLDFKAALDWLRQRFPVVPPPACGSPAPHAPFKPPPPEPNRLRQVQRYLVTQRAIAPTVVQSLIQSGRLYADHRGNAVFLMMPPGSGTARANRPIGAELRGTSAARWRGLALGSRRDWGCFGIPSLRLSAQGPDRSRLILCESAIDAISCFALYPDYYCLSTAGARPDPAWLPALLNRGCQVFCGFDADTTGDQMAQAMIQLHPAIQRLRPAAHDWNDLLQSQA